MNINYDRLKKIDEYSKSLGVTLYNITYGFYDNNEHFTHVINDFNISPQRAKEPNVKGLAECL